eukprot:151092-Prorocentrum_minimum.AAC.3
MFNRTTNPLRAATCRPHIRNPDGGATDVVLANGLGPPENGLLVILVRNARKEVEASDAKRGEKVHRLQPSHRGKVTPHIDKAVAMLERRCG